VTDVSSYFITIGGVVESLIQVCGYLGVLRGKMRERHIDSAKLSLTGIVKDFIYRVDKSFLCLYLFTYPLKSFMMNKMESDRM
jgi:hypothetical protein